MIKKTMNEFVIHFLYLLIVSSLCYANRNNNAYRMHKVISDQLITDTKTGFKQINSSKEFFNWTTTILTPWLLPDLNTKVDSNLDRLLYTEVKDLYRIGAARLRQLRIEKENCNVLNIKLKDCVPGYTSGLEETKDFCLNWMPKPCSVLENLQVRSSSAWTYKSAQDVWGLPIAGSFSIYGGGGYIVNLNINSKIATDLLNEMKKHLWIDQLTRAVFLEFTVYSPNINHFAFVILLIEFIETGSTIPFVNIYPFPVHNPPGYLCLGTYVQMCQVIGIVVTLLGVMYVVFIFGKKKWSAFKDIWFLLDTSAVVIAICAVVMFMLRLRYTKSALIKLKENRNNYINFYHIVIWDTAYSWCLAWLVAIGYMRVLKLASYSEKTMKIYTVLSKSVRIFPGFLFFTIIILLGFIGMGYALFGKTSYYFKDLLTTAESLFTGLLGRSSFRDTNVTLSDRWTTILYFCLFVAIVVIFLTNYFIAVLMDLLVNTGNTFLEEESTQIFSVLWDSFLKIFGSKRNPSDRLKYLIKDDVEVEDETKSIEEENMANKLERRIDRLFDEFFSEMENFSRKKEISHSLQEFDDLGSNMSLK